MTVALSSTPRSSLAHTGDARSAPSDSFFAHHGFWAPGIRLFRRMGFAAKASIISLAFVVPMIALLVWQIATQYQDALQARKDEARQRVELALGLLAWAHDQEASGAMSTEQAQQTALATLARLRSDERMYFWVNDMQPKMLMHPFKPALAGKDLTDIKDPNGVALFVEFVKAVREQGQGYVAYQWPEPGSDKPVDKLSYVKGYAPWGWVVGSGIYVKDVVQTTTSRATMAAGIVMAALAGACYLFMSFYRVMDGGLKETRRHLRAITDGDLTTSPSPWGRDEAAQLMLELRKMQQSLRSMVQQVRTASDDILHSSGEIATGSMDLSARTEQAAANLEESAASMEEIAATTRNTSAHTGEAAQVARHSAEVAAEGGRIMQEVIATMDGIRASSGKIGDIVGTIDGLAFQTNLLALNAAVEAARAGEQGRGFAVVASEVRTLAQHSANAAKEIKVLIARSVEQVEAGTGVVRTAGQAINDMVSSSQRVDQLLTEIATGAREQTAGIGQMAQAIQELEHMTQQNAALVEETAAASSTMREQARSLSDEVARFQLPG